MDRKKVLVVDDEKLVVDPTAEWLEEFGYEVKKSFDGQSAWDYLKNNPVDILISDQNMPGMNGAELIRKVRERYGENIYIISMPGFPNFSGDCAFPRSCCHIPMVGRVTQLEDSELNGADCIIAKPFKIELLHAIIAGMRR